MCSAALHSHGSSSGRREKNRKFADEVGAYFQKVDPWKGVTWEDIVSAKDQLHSRCDCDLQVGETDAPQESSPVSATPNLAPETAPLPGRHPVLCILCTSCEI